jgi:hypothetical protein
MSAMRQIEGTKAQGHSFLIPPALDAVNGQLHTLTVLPPRDRIPDTH